MNKCHETWCILINSTTVVVAYYWSRCLYGELSRVHPTSDLMAAGIGSSCDHEMDKWKKMDGWKLCT